MKCIFCQSEEIRIELMNDEGLDHHHFELKKNRKEYAFCKSCKSIFRLDKNIPSFIDPDYIKLDRFPTKASSNLVNKKDSLKSELPKSLSFRNIEILNAIDRHKLIKNGDNICEFGANNGQLLNAINSLYDIHLKVGIEIDLFKNLDYGYRWYGNVTDTLKENKIDLFIASHALVLTDYLDFISGINESKDNINNVIIVSQNPLNRPATLFYDDCISNPSIAGKSELLKKHGFNIIEAGFLPNHPYETIVIGSKNKESKIDNTYNEYADFSIKNQKEKIMNIYKLQSETIEKNKIDYIFGTGIDSSLLAHQCKRRVAFVKDYVQGNEIFLGEKVFEINDISDKKFIIPKFLSNSEKVFERFKKRNLNVFI